MSAWSCPNDLNSICQRVMGAQCDPGMRGCELEGKVRFSQDAMNLSRKPKKAEPTAEASPTKQRTRTRLPF